MVKRSTWLSAVVARGAGLPVVAARGAWLSAARGPGLSMALARRAWLSLTPEPERELPAAVATLRLRRTPPVDAVSAERERIERLILAGHERQWLAYLSEVVALIERRGADEEVEVARARETAIAVIGNHHNLLLGLPGPAGERTAPERERLARLTSSGRPPSARPSDPSCDSRRAPR
jgi:hypothetical protein